MTPKMATVGRESTRRVPSSDSRTPAPAGAFSGSARILTADGEMPIAHLLPGDRIVTRETGLVPLVGLVPFRGMARLVSLKPAALGRAMPMEALALTEAQEVLWRAGGLTCTGAELVELGLASELGWRACTLLELVLESAQTVYIEGAELRINGSEEAASAVA